MVITHYFRKLDGTHNVLFNHIYFPMLYDLACNKNVTVAQIIGYNKYYLMFDRPFNNILRQ
jgi:hypothetical protein